MDKILVGFAKGVSEKDDVKRPYMMLSVIEGTYQYFDKGEKYYREGLDCCDFGASYDPDRKRTTANTSFFFYTDEITVVGEPKVGCGCKILFDRNQYGNLVPAFVEFKGLVIDFSMLQPDSMKPEFKDPANNFEDPFNKKKDTKNAK